MTPTTRLGNPVCMCGACWFNYAMPIAAEKGAVSREELIELMINFLKAGVCPNAKRVNDLL
jgi:hypothetical protein